MSKIVKKKDLDVLIESTLKKAGIDSNVVKKQLTSVGIEPTDEEMGNIKDAIQMDNERKSSKSNKKSIKKESTSSDKSLINEELMRFNKLTNYTYKK